VQIQRPHHRYACRTIGKETGKILKLTTRARKSPFKAEARGFHQDKGRDSWTKKKEENGRAEITQTAKNRQRKNSSQRLSSSDTSVGRGPAKGQKGGDSGRKKIKDRRQKLEAEACRRDNIRAQGAQRMPPENRNEVSGGKRHVSSSRGAQPGKAGGRRQKATNRNTQGLALGTERKRIFPLVQKELKERKGSLSKKREEEPWRRGRDAKRKVADGEMQRRQNRKKSLTLENY